MKLATLVASLFLTVVSMLVRVLAASRSTAMMEAGALQARPSSVTRKERNVKLAHT